MLPVSFFGAIRFVILKLSTKYSGRTPGSASTLSLSYLPAEEKITFLIDAGLFLNSIGLLYCAGSIADIVNKVLYEANFSNGLGTRFGKLYATFPAPDAVVMLVDAGLNVAPVDPIRGRGSALPIIIAIVIFLDICQDYFF